MVAKKRKRAKKKDKPPITSEDQTIPTDVTTTIQDTPATLLGESMLNQLRSRLDPLYNASPPLPTSSESASLPPMRLPPLEHSKRGPPVLSLSTEERGGEQASTDQEDTSVREGEPAEGGTSQKGSCRKTKRRKSDTQRASPRQPSDIHDGATTSEDVSEQQEELKSTSREVLIAGATGGSERKKRRRREGERSRRTSGRTVGEDTPDAGEEVTTELTDSRGLDSNIDSGSPPPTNEGTWIKTKQLSQ